MPRSAGPLGRSLARKLVKHRVDRRRGHIKGFRELCGGCSLAELGDELEELVAEPALKADGVVVVLIGTRGSPVRFAVDNPVGYELPTSCGHS